MDAAERSAGHTERDKAFQAELVALIPHLRAFARTLCGNAAAADDLGAYAVRAATLQRRIAAGHRLAFTRARSPGVHPRLRDTRASRRFARAVEFLA